MTDIHFYRLSASCWLSLPVRKLLILSRIYLASLLGLLIGSSFVFKKKGLLRSQAGHELGEGVAYLKSVSLRSHLPLLTMVDRVAAYVVVRYVISCAF
jgi:hypothetical protein